MSVEVATPTASQGEAPKQAFAKKSHAIRAALKELGNNAANKAVIEHCKSKYNMDVTPENIAGTKKTDAKGANGVAPKKVGRPRKKQEEAPAQETPAQEAATPVNGAATETSNGTWTVSVVASHDCCGSALDDVRCVATVHGINRVRQALNELEVLANKLLS